MEKKQIVISEVKKLLEDGMNRKEITAMYGLNKREVDMLWSHPSLKGVKKAKYSVGITLVDDTPVTQE